MLATLSPVTLLTLTVVGGCVLFRIVHFFYSLRCLRLTVDKIPGPASGSLLLGHLALMREIKNNVTNWYQQIFNAFIGIARLYQQQNIGFIRLWFGPANPVVVVVDAECAEGILTSNVNIRKSKEFDFSIPWLGLGLFTATGDRWRAHRKMLTPAFHFRILESFVPIIQKQQLIMQQQIQANMDENRVINDVKPLITNCALDIICETAMGVSIHAQTDPDCKYSREVRSVLDLFMLRFLSPWLWNDWMFAISPTGIRQRKTIKFLHNFTEQVIKRKRKELEDKLASGQTLEQIAGGSGSSKKVLAFLDSLLMQNIQQPNTFSDEDIRSEVDTFMSAGQDTSSATIQFALQLIGNHPDVQAKIHEELDTIFGDGDRELKFEDLREMKYLERVIKETLRLFPPVLFIARQIEQEMKIKDKVIPKGVTVLVLFYQLHRDPRYFPKPETFDPDRFAPENASGRHAFSYTPFSAGPRNCIGQRFAIQTTKALIACILRQYRITSLLPMDKVELAIGSTMGPKNPIPLRMDKR